MCQYGRSYGLFALLATIIALAASGSGLAADAVAAHDYSRDQARSTPAWVRDGVVYQIFPRNFSASGDFNGVTAQLDRLQKLGVNVLWLMPINPIGVKMRKGTLGSPYSVRDYYAINPDYGTASDLKRLVSEAHQRGLKVIADVVVNHTSWDSVLMKTPAFYTHDAGGKIVSPQPDWADVADLNYDNPALRTYIIDMLKFWLREYDLDGFRCDVALLIPTDFWERARVELSKVKSDIVMLAEAEQADLLASAFDLDYDWTLYSALSDVLQGRKPASQLRDTWIANQRRYQRGALRLQFSDNHDERRAIAMFGEPASLAASALMFTLDGVPLIYNGMEVGDTAESGWPALFEKMPIFWPVAERRPEFPVFYQQLIALRKAHAALRQGELQWLRNSDETRLLSFRRRDAQEDLVVVLNLSSLPLLGIVEADGGAYEDISPRTTGSETDATRAGALPAVSLGAWEYRIFRRR